MADPIKLYTEWKVPLSKSNYRPVAVQASLFDLMFYHDGDKIGIRWNQNNSDDTHDSITN